MTDYLQVVEDIDDLLSSKRRWTKQQYKRPSVLGTRYCLLGAGTERGHAHSNVARALGFDTAKEVEQWNDANFRTFFEVKELLTNRKLELGGTPQKPINLHMSRVFQAHSKNWKTYLPAPEAAPVMHDSHNFSLAGD